MIDRGPGTALPRAHHGEERDQPKPLTRVLELTHSLGSTSAGQQAAEGDDEVSVLSLYIFVRRFALM